MIARAMAIAGAAALVAGGAIYGALTLLDRPPNPASTARICLERDLPLFEGSTKDCYKPEDFASLAHKAVLDEEGRIATVSLSHPTDASAGMRVAENCEEFRNLKAEGWYALSTKDMRRDAVFERACGTLAAIEKGRPAEVSYFDKQGLTETDVRSLAQTGDFKFGPDSAGSASAAQISRTDNGWRISSPTQTAIVQELAQADFNADGRGDVLVFITMLAEGGTATSSELGLLDRISASAPVRFIAQ